MLLAIATCTYYESLDDLRAQLALRTLSLAAKYKIPVALVDGGSPQNVVDAFKARGAHVFSQEDWTFGSAWRQAIREAFALSESKGVLRTEPEKYTFLDIVPTVAACIRDGMADIVYGDRRPMDSFPEIQRYSELFGDKYVFDLLGLDIDLFAGPSVIGPKAIPFFLDYRPEGEAEDPCDTMHLPVLRAIAAGLKVVNVKSNYVHPQEMKKAEEGDVAMNEKRLRQLGEVLIPLTAEARRLGIARS